MTPRQITTLLLLLFSLIFPPKTQLKSVPKPKITPTQNQVQIFKAIDGDTLKVDIGGTPATVRLIGLDTPEVVDPRKPVQCFGREASTKMHSLADNHLAILKSDPSQEDKDKYGRLLRYVTLDDGTFLNKYMIEQGYGHEYTYDIPYQYQSEFKAAQASASAAHRGLWDPSVCP